jgi:hypothetical protein
VEVRFKGDELRGWLPGRGRGGSASWGRGKEEEAKRCPIPRRGGGQRHTVVRGTAAPARPTVARATEVGDKQGSGLSGLRRPIGQLGQSGPRQPVGAHWAGTE